MNEPNINQLLKLYEEGKATEEQRKLVEAYLAWHQQQSPARDAKDDPATDPLNEIMEKIRLEREPKEAPVYPMGETGKRRRMIWVAAAASIMVVVAAGLLWRNGENKRAEPQTAVIYKTIKAAPGKTIHLLLSDSSEVWLNAGAVLRYPQPFGDSTRKLALLDGEAFFQIHPDANRGFEVQTDHLLTRVLGTSFNIKAYRESQQRSVAVTSGKVEVQGMTLIPDQEARYNIGTGRLTRGSLNAARTTEWKSGMFNFMEESLGDIAIELEHYFDVHIDFKYPGLKKYMISASFRQATPLKDMLTTLCLLNQNHFIQIDAQHYVIR